MRAHERLDRLPVDLQLQVEGEGGLGAELHHSKNPAAAGGEVGWLDHVFRVDRQEREAAASENWPKRSDKRFRLAARSLIVDDDATVRWPVVPLERITNEGVAVLLSSISLNRLTGR